MKKRIEIDLSVLFERFMGQPVELDPAVSPTGTRIYNAPFEKNPALAEMEQLAAEHGLRFKVWTPQTPGKKEFYANRVNVTMRQNKDNGDRWEITGAANDSGVSHMTLFPRDLLPKREKKAADPAPVPEPPAQNIRIMKQLRLKGIPKP